MGKTRAEKKTHQVTLDAGALIAIDRGDRRMIALLDELLKRKGKLRVPAGALGQAWRDGSRQATLARLIRSTEVEVVPLDEQLARACGELLRASGTADVIDASVVLVAKRHEDTILTSDIDDLAALDPRAVLVKI